MDEHAREDVARRAGVEPEYVDRLVECGILTPASDGRFSAGDVRRARWVRAFEDSGVPLDGMAAAVRDGVLSLSYLDAAAFDRFAGIRWDPYVIRANAYRFNRARFRQEIAGVVESGLWAKRRRLAQS